MKLKLERWHAYEILRNPTLAHKSENAKHAL